MRLMKPSAATLRTVPFNINPISSIDLYSWKIVLRTLEDYRRSSSGNVITPINFETLYSSPGLNRN